MSTTITSFRAAALAVMTVTSLLAPPASAQLVRLHSGYHHQPSTMILNDLWSIESLLQDLTSSPNLAAHRPGSSEVYSELLGVGCTPVQTLHKEIQNLPTESTLTLYVTRTCSSETRAALANISALASADGELAIKATPEGSSSAFDQAFTLPRNADASSITATYNETSRVLTVSVSIVEPSPLEIKVQTVTEAAPSQTPAAPEALPAPPAPAPTEEGRGIAAAGAASDSAGVSAAEDARQREVAEEIRKLEAWSSLVEEEVQRIKRGEASRKAPGGGGGGCRLALRGA